MSDAQGSAISGAPRPALGAAAPADAVAGVLRPCRASANLDRGDRIHLRSHRHRHRVTRTVGATKVFPRITAVDPSSGTQGARCPASIPTLPSMPITWSKIAVGQHRRDASRVVASSSINAHSTRALMAASLAFHGEVNSLLARVSSVRGEPHGYRDAERGAFPEQPHRGASGLDLKGDRERTRHKFGRRAIRDSPGSLALQMATEPCRHFRGRNARQAARSGHAN